MWTWTHEEVKKKQWTKSVEIKNINLLFIIICCSNTSTFLFYITHTHTPTPTFPIIIFKWIMQRENGKSSWEHSICTMGKNNFIPGIYVSCYMFVYHPVGCYFYFIRFRLNYISQNLPWHDRYTYMHVHILILPRWKTVNYIFPFLPLFFGSRQIKYNRNVRLIYYLIGRTRIFIFLFLFVFVSFFLFFFVFVQFSSLTQSN